MSSRRKSLTPEQRVERSIRAKRRFRAIVKMIIANLSWLQEIEDEQLGDNVKRNIQVLTRKKGKKSLLTLSDKAVLNKPQEFRTEAEKNHLRRLIGNLKCFRRYPPEVKKELPGVMYFCYFGSNRVIVKQDYEPLNMYVIVSGEVVVSVSYYDKLLKEMVTKDVNLMGPGSYFGEVSLLHGVNRTATVTTTQPSEFLYIKRDDFDRVLKSTVSNLWAEIKKDMSCFSYFKKWDELEIRESCILARKKTFYNDEIMLSSTGGQHDYVYFIVKGSCYLIEYMTIRTEYKNRLPYYYLMEEKEDKRLALALKKDIKKIHRPDEGSSERVKHLLRPVIPSSRLTFTDDLEGERVHFMKVCTFNQLACFNVGESLKNRVIVADGQVECLLLPQYFLFEKATITFKTIQQYLKQHIPGTKQIFQQFLEEKRWKMHKAQMVGDCLSKKVSSCGNTVHNVPYSIRLTEDLIG